MSACTAPTSVSTSTQVTLVLTNGTLLDGTGADPLPNALLVIRGERIVAVGAASQVEIRQGRR